MAKTIISSAIEIWKAIAKKKEPVVQDGKPLVTSAEVSSGKVKDTSKVNVVSSSASVKSISDKYSGNVQEEVKKISSGKSSSGGAVTQADYVIQGTPKPDLEYQAQAVKTTAQQQDLQIRLEQLKEEQRRIEQAKILTAQTAVFSASDYFSAENIKKREIAKVEEQLKSVRGVSQEEIDRAVKSGKVTSREGLLATAYTGTKGIEERYKQDAKNYEQILLEESKQNLEKEREQLLRVYDNEFQRIQEKVNQGYNIKLAEKEWDKITKDLEKIDKGLTEKENKRIQEKYSEWNKKWQETTGVELGKSVQRDLTRTKIKYQKQDFWNLKKQGERIIKPATTGVAVGAGVSAGARLLSVIKPVGKVITKVGTKVTGAGVAIGLTGWNFVTSLGRRGVQEKIYLEQGFSKKEAFDLARVEANYNLAQSQIEMGAFMGGAYLGAGAVNYVANIGKIMPAEQSLIKKTLEKNPDAVRMQGAYGKIKDTQIQVLMKENPNAQIGVVEGNKVVLKPIAQIRTGDIVRYNVLGLDKTGLTAKEIKVLNKVVKTINARELTITSLKENKFFQSSVGELETPFLNQIRIAQSVGKITPKGRYSAKRVVQVYDKTPTTLFEKVAPKVIKDYPFLDVVQKESIFSTIKGKGSVKFPELKDGSILRVEKGVGVEKEMARAIFKKGIWTETKLSKTITATKSGFISEPRFINRNINFETKGATITTSATSFDIASRQAERTFQIFKKGKPLPKIKTPKLSDIKFNIPKAQAPPTSSIKTIDSTEPLGYGIPRSTGGTGVVGLASSQELSAVTRGSSVFEIPTKPMFDIGNIVKGTTKGLSATKTTIPVGKTTLFDTGAESSLLTKAEKEQKMAPAIISTPIFDSRSFAKGEQASKTSSILSTPLISESLVQPEVVKPLIQPSLFIPFKPLEPTSKIPTPIIPFGFLGTLETGGGQRREERRISIFGKTKYTPSLGSVLAKEKKEKITQKEYEKRSKKKYTGLERRPLFEIVDK